MSAKGKNPQKNSIETDLSLSHLQAELVHIDILIHREVRRWQLAGQDPTNAFRGLTVSHAEADQLLARPFGTSWGQMTPLTAEETHLENTARTEADKRIRSVIETAQNQGQTLRLVELARTFGLSRFEVDALLVCLIPNLDLSYERLYGYLQNDVTRRWPTINLILDLLAEAGPARLSRLVYFADDAPLLRFNLLERQESREESLLPLPAHTLHIDPTIVAWLLGHYRPQANLDNYATLLQPQPDQADDLLAVRIGPRLTRLAASDNRPLVIFHGADRMAQQAAARLLAVQLGRSLLQVNLEAIIKTGLPPRQALRLALRDARLTGALPCLLGWDACLPGKGHGSPPPELLAELYTFPNIVIVAGERNWQIKNLEPGRDVFRFELPMPLYAHRLDLWQHFLNVETPLNLESLAGQFTLTTGQISDTITLGHSIAAQREDTLQNEDLFAAARAQSNPRLADLARKITSRYNWDDIILPPDQLAILRELVATVRRRPLVLEEWGVGKKLVSSNGVTVLFAGPPGTGKTMAAEVIAGELQLDLYKIDLSTVISKYIGETEKNLEKIFTEAASSNAILFFDEADAIFGKRSEVKDAHDRYANIEVSYLLQRMEAYDGVTILATNLRANLDEAFTRRLQFALDFPFPRTPYRLQIWQTLFPPNVPRVPDLNFDLLAERFKLAGGSIRNVIVNAAYLAAEDGGRVNMDHMMHAVRRELQKMGRMVDKVDLKIETSEVKND